MNIGIIGCGWLGLKLATRLKEDYTIYTTTTSIAKVKPLTSQGLNPRLIRFSDDNNTFEKTKWIEKNTIDVLIVAIPFSERFWTKEKLQNRFNNLSNFIDKFKGQIYYTSSTSVYPNENKTYIETDVNPKESFIENLFISKFPQINILRLGGLMGDNRLLKNYNIKETKGVVNHIHYTDIYNIIRELIQNKTSKAIFNLVAPINPSKLEVINTQKGIDYIEEEITQKRIISSEKIISELNYQFEYPNPKWFHL